jgi:DNA polymerase-3 subunit epsilon
LPREYDPDADAYLDVLDRVLVGRFVSAVHADALVALADRLGLGRSDVHALHVRYLRALIAAADPVTPEQRRELAAVAALLGLEESDVDGPAGEPASPVALGRFRLVAGDVVVFTGQTAEPREVWEQRARTAGLVVGAGVTKATRLLVAADPDTMSGKADRAHRYGLPVVHPAAFAALLAAM